MPTTIERAILSTLAYFDGFSYPLTVLETWKWLHCDPGTPAPTLNMIRELLIESPFLHERIDQSEGMFFLRGRSEIVGLRKERYMLAERKYERLRRAMRVLRYLPFLRAVAVCNSLAYANARDESDLDVLVIAEPGRLWTARMFATGIAALLRWRPTARTTRDTLCLSFYLSGAEDSLRRLTVSEDDLYFRYWLDQLALVYGDGRRIAHLQSTNRWYTDRLPNAYGTEPAARRVTHDTVLSRSVKRTLEALHSGSLGRWLEGRYRTWQKRHLPEKLKRLANADTRVIVNNTMLKFHENDRRAEFQSRHAMRLHELLGT